MQILGIFHDEQCVFEACKGEIRLSLWESSEYSPFSQAKSCQTGILVGRYQILGNFWKNVSVLRNWDYFPYFLEKTHKIMAKIVKYLQIFQILSEIHL